ncbi:phospholipase A2 inhibitor and Ly6/PLAUR domain-containing protein-like isoform 2-T2 [Anomaloglossus baeobatrachus]|uniref:phospholipase A2 inhibitor and Ly6/PLAUR domain-containing protein-like isoform X2 n=1 Tax=Anomaloglossus baeobatrachus TaxID=238106 RepID=UPI003F5032A8
MKNLVILLCMISTIDISVFSYKCNFCWSPNSTTCEQSETECLGDQCMTVSQYYNLSGKIYNSMYKGCANKTLCGTKGFTTVENVKFQFKVNCCIGDSCNNEGYELPKDDPTPNGVKCPSAYCINTLEECKGDKEMNCTGSMDRCLDYRATVRSPYGTDTNYSAKGCANSDCCNYNFDSKIGFEEIHRVLLKC